MQLYKMVPGSTLAGELAMTQMKLHKQRSCT